MADTTALTKTLSALRKRLITRDRLLDLLADHLAERHTEDKAAPCLSKEQCAVCDLIAKARNREPFSDERVQTIGVEISGGCLLDVVNLPPGWNYILIDFDNIKEQGEPTVDEERYYKSLGLEFPEV